MSTRSRVSCDIDLDDRTPGRRIGWLRIPHSRHESGFGVIPVPIAVLDGGDGASVLLTAGNHGDEYEGQVVLRDLIRARVPYADAERAVLKVARVPMPAFDQAARAGDFFKQEAEAAVLGMKTPQQAMDDLVRRVQPLLA